VSTHVVRFYIYTTLLIEHVTREESECAFLKGSNRQQKERKNRKLFSNKSRREVSSCKDPIITFTISPSPYNTPVQDSLPSSDLIRQNRRVWTVWPVATTHTHFLHYFHYHITVIDRNLVERERNTPNKQEMANWTLSSYTIASNISQASNHIQNKTFSPYETLLGTH